MNKIAIIIAALFLMGMASAQQVSVVITPSPATLPATGGPVFVQVAVNCGTDTCQLQQPLGTPILPPGTTFTYSTSYSTQGTYPFYVDDLTTGKTSGPYLLTVSGYLFFTLITNSQQWCSNFFNSNNPYVGKGLANATTYTSIVSLTALVILMVLMVIGIVYMVGYAFHIEKLIIFAKTEVLESVANLILLVLIAGGIGFTGGIVSFVANLASLGTGGISPAVGVNGLYNGICVSYVNNIIDPVVNNVINVIAAGDFFTVLDTATFYLAPNNGGLIPYTPGISVQPWDGVGPISWLFQTELAIYGAIAGVAIAVILLLMVIYFLFPLLLYLGILLRSFPWTRAAGGALVAVFIAFYIIFPAIMYPFALSPVKGINSQSCGSSNPFCVSASTFNINSFLNTLLSSIEALTADFNPPLLGDALIAYIESFISQVAYVVLQLIGFIIAIIVSFDLLEELGKVLGAPSLKGKDIISKVV